MSSALPRAVRLFAILLLVGCAARLSATPILLGETTGKVANLEAVYGRLTSQIDGYTAAQDWTLPEAIFADAVKINVGGDQKTFSLDVTGWSYVVLKAGPTNYHYYVGDDTGLVSFRTPKGLSNYSFFKGYNPEPPPTPPASVPDAGGSATLLGIGLIGLAIAYRRVRG